MKLLPRLPLLALCSASLLPAAEKAAAPKVVPYAQILGPIRLWEGDAPGALGQRPQDIPTLTPYPADPARKTGASILIFPGGGYGGLKPAVQVPEKQKSPGSFLSLRG